MFSFFKYSVLAFIIIPLLVIIFVIANSFLCITMLNSVEISDILTICVSFLSVAIIGFTLLESKIFNTKQLAINEYNILTQDFELFFKHFEQIRFTLSEEHFSKNFIIISNNSSGIDYINLLSTFLFSEAERGDDVQKRKRKNEFLSKVIFPLTRGYNNLYLFIEEVYANDILTDKYKGKFYFKAEQLILQNYFRICNNSAPNGALHYELGLLETNNFKIERFLKLNQLYIDKGLFRVNDLQFYKETT